MVSGDNIEIKALGGDVGDAFDDFMRVFETFKQANDERLDQIEQTMAVDAVTSAKLARIDKALDAHKQAVDALVHKVARPALGSVDGAGATRDLYHKAAFEGYVRKGDAGALRELEAKALSVATDADGGYLVPEETEAAINASLKDVSAIRAIAGVRQVSGSVYKRPFARTGAASGWVGEKSDRPETGSPTLVELSFPTMELYAMPSATQALLDDSVVDIDQWIGEEVRSAFAEQEGRAFVTGDGSNKPRGFMSYDTIANGSWAWGKIGTVKTGAAGAFAEDGPSDALIDLVYALRAPYRSNAHFVMNRSTQASVRKLKDGDGNYVWHPGMAPGQAATLMGFAIAESEDMPDVADGANAIAFGDFRLGYLIVDRVGIRVLRDPYSAKPYVLFYTTKRVGGGVQDFDAIKLLKFAQ